jgi:mRNA (guanine-N7-)-methyltransferase
MKLNKQTNEKQRLLQLINKSHQNKKLELEALVYHQGIKKNISYNDFISCLKRIKNQKEFKMFPAKEVLNIYFRSDSKYKNVRVLIYGKETIKYYCAHGRLKDLGNNVKYYEKISVFNDDGKPARVDIDNYYLRFNLKEENPLDASNSLIKDLLDHWMEVPKFFRYKKTFTFETIDGLFRNDLSIVKESRTAEKEMSVSEVFKQNLEEFVIKQDDHMSFKDWWNSIKNKPNFMVKVAGQPIFTQSFQKSGTLEATAFYEIEVEYLGNQKGQKTMTDEEILVKFIEIIGIHLQAIQKSYFIIGKFDVGKIRNNLMKLTGIRGKNMFKASLPKTVELSDLQQLTNRQYLDPSNQTLRKNFLVTEKADGERNLLYIDPTGEFYFINRDNLVRMVGIKMPDIANTLLDGEYLEDQKLLMVFDAYYFKGQETWREIFDPRYEAVKQVTEYIKINVNNPSSVSNVDVRFPMMIGRKTYYRGDVILKTDDLDASNFDTHIFDACKKILNQVNVKQGGKLDIGHQYSYNVDGLIFIPNNLYVGQDYPGQEIQNFSEASSWSRTYKWKPPFLNSIDFEIEVFHPKSNNDTNDQYYNGILYRQVIVKSNYQNDFHNRYNSQRVLNEGLSEYNGGIPFKPNYPFIGEADFNGGLVEESHIAWIPIDNNSNMITMDGITVQSGDVVEFSYDLNETNLQHRWKPIRARIGKKANGYHTAINIWRSIHLPITTDMIIGDEKLSKTDMYYQCNVDREELYIKEMNKFHNYVKGKLYDHLSKDIKHPFIIDLACGKFGDYFKWINIKAGFVLGIDYSNDNINNFNNGAATRAINSQEKDSLIKKFNNNIMAIWGDCSKPINTTDAGCDELNKYYLRVLYGDVELGDYSKLGKLNGKAMQKFDIVSNQFSIHYFFENYEKLTGFLNNVHQNCRTNGYFMGTCLDGKTIYNRFKNNKDSVLEQYQDPEKTKLIWRIKKMYDNKAMENDETSLGMKINVDIECINNTSQEYLVNFDYLTKIMNEYGFELVDSKLFNEIPNSMLEEFYSDNKSQGEILRKKSKVLEYSNLHRWFIFTKKGLPEDTVGLTREEESEITDASFDKSSDNSDQEKTKESSESESSETDTSKKIKKGGNLDDFFIEELNIETIKL